MAAAAAAAADDDDDDDDVQCLTIDTYHLQNGSIFSEPFLLKCMHSLYNVTLTEKILICRNVRVSQKKKDKKTISISDYFNP